MNTLVAKFSEKEKEMNVQLDAATKLLEEKEMEFQEDKMRREAIAKEKKVLEELLGDTEREDEAEKKAKEIRENYEQKMETLRAELSGKVETEKEKFEKEMEAIRLREEEAKRAEKEKAKEVKLVEEKHLEEEKKRKHVEAKLGEVVEILQKKETDLLEKIKEVNDANNLLIEVQKIANDREVINKERERQVKESIGEVAVFRGKLQEAEMKAMEMKGRSKELEARIESMKIGSDLRGTFDMLTKQLQSANEDRDEMLKEKIKFDESARARVEDELEEQRKMMERARQEDKMAMDEKVRELTKVVEGLMEDRHEEKEMEMEKEKEKVGPSVIADESFSEIDENAMVEKRVEELQNEILRYKELIEGHEENETQLKKALKRIIHMKQKASQVKSFYNHKMEEAQEDKEEFIERLAETKREKVQIEEELKSAQLVVMNMEAESEEHRSRFDKVVVEIKERDAKLERAKKEVEKLRRGVGVFEEERKRSEDGFQAQVSRLRKQLKGSADLGRR